jgi:UDP-4-amino-4,6-dideoxy-N-acetyl-beta-L-altrosamine N-acetyltransferase
MNDGRGIRDVREDDLPMLLAWRNHPQVRSFMLSRHEIDLDEHRIWFEKVSRDPTRCMLIVNDDDGPVGFVQFADVMKGGISDWGFYARPDAPKGTGRKIGGAALDHAFGALGLHKVCGQAVADNKASIALHRALGFIEEGVLRDQKRIDGAYHSLICFGLMEHEWRSGEVAPESKA